MELYVFQIEEEDPNNLNPEILVMKCFQVEQDIPEEVVEISGEQQGYQMFL